MSLSLIAVLAVSTGGWAVIGIGIFFLLCLAAIGLWLWSIKHDGGEPFM